MTETTKAIVPDSPLWIIRLRLSWKKFREGWAMFKQNPIGIIGLVIIVLFFLMVVIYPLLFKFDVWNARIYDPIIGYDFDILIHPSPPTWLKNDLDPMWQRSFRHILGTDPLGRDVLSQLMFSAKSEFILGVGSALITVFVATSIGAIAAYYGGLIDMVFMRIADVVLMLPFIAILIVLSSLFDFELRHLAIVYGILAGFGGTTIVMKSQALTIKVKAYIEAARIAGGNDFHIIFKHLVPNLLPLSFLYMMISVTGAIFTEAVLSFFGLLNIQMSWGLMIQTTQASGYLLNSWKYWYLMFPAGLSITLLCAAFYLVGRGLDEIINPRLRKR